MSVVFRFLSALIVLLSASSLAASAAPGPIVIQQCFITVPKHLSQKASGTQITYINQGHVNATKVTFAVGYRNSNEKYLRKVEDVGSFAPGVPVDHHFDLYNDVQFGGKTTTSCSVVNVVFANGKTWHP